jgi:hypothetical protein
MMGDYAVSFAVKKDGAKDKWSEMRCDNYTIRAKED